MGADPSRVDLVAEPRGNLPIVPWFMAGRGAGLCLGIALICSSSGLQRVWDKHHPHAGRGTQPSHLLVLVCWRVHPSWRMIPSSARTELLHQSKGMKLSPAFQSHSGAVLGSQNPEMASVQPCFSSPLERLQQRETWVTDQGLQDKAQPQLHC